MIKTRTMRKYFNFKIQFNNKKLFKNEKSSSPIELLSWDGVSQNYEETLNKM